MKQPKEFSLNSHGLPHTVVWLIILIILGLAYILSLLYGNPEVEINDHFPIVEPTSKPTHTFPPEALAATYSIRQYRVCTGIIGGHVNVREGPGIDFGIVLTVSEGTALFSTEFDEYRGWENLLGQEGKIHFQGYVNSKYLCEVFDE